MIFGGDHDTKTNGKWSSTGKVAQAFIAFDGAVITEIKDFNGTALTKAYITAGTALPAGFLGTFDRPIQSITCTGTIVVYGIRDAQNA